MSRLLATTKVTQPFIETFDFERFDSMHWPQSMWSNRANAQFTM